MWGTKAPRTFTALRHSGRNKGRNEGMKKKLITIAMCALLAMGMCGLVACSSGSDSSDEEATTEEEATEATTGTISVYSREDGSGTRGAFVELLGIEQEDESGEAVDMTTSSAAITNSTSVMMTSVAGDELGIGYISLGSLDDSVKAITVDGVEATTDNVKSGDYAVSRPFNIVTGDELSDVAQDFIDYILSSDGQAVIEEEGYIAIDDAASAYEASGLSGKVVVAGSSSVTPVMEKLAEAYQELNADVTIEVQQPDSSTGVTMAQEGTCDIGMASRDLKDEETGVEATAIAMDGIAVIVNNASSIEGLTSEQIMQIYTGEITTWDELS